MGFKRRVIANSHAIPQANGQPACELSRKVLASLEIHQYA
jgi:hypothetical protein